MKPVWVIAVVVIMYAITNITMIAVDRCFDIDNAVQAKYQAEFGGK